MDLLRSLMFLVAVCHLFLWDVNCEYFTSVVGLEALLRTKEEVVYALEEYLKAEEDRLRKVKMYKEEYKRLFQNESSDVERIVTNPVNAYLLVKRLTADWQRLRGLLNSYEAAMENVFAQQPDIKFPSDEDLAGAAEGLVRLQKTYKLNTTALANGYILGIKTPEELSAGDCFEIGRQMFSAEDYEYCSQWMEETLYRLDKEPTKTANRAETLETLAYSLYMKKNIGGALRLTNELLEIVPDHPRALGNKEYYEFALSKKGNFTTDEDTHPLNSELLRYQLLSEPLCRGEKVLTAAKESKLKCHYSHGINPYFLLLPFKVEELLLDPEILLYHNFLTDKEIDTIISLAEPRLRRAAVAASEGEKELFSSHRISKIAWISDDDHSTIQRISQKIEGATGLTLSTAEELQVLNYGIGGHYEAHFDFATRGEFPSLREEVGDRIATWLNYMSDVDAGGATAFPEIGVSVKPEKGSAVLWFNLLRNGTGDLRTRHTACPVLLGSKWVSNKWIHERGQEFTRKCGTKNE